MPELTSGWQWGSEGRAWASHHQGFSSRDFNSSKGFSASAFVEQWLKADPKRSSRLGGVFLRELSSLSQEKDPEMFFTGFLALGERLEAAGKVAVAGEIYGALVDLGAEAPRYSSGNKSVARGFSPAHLVPISAKAQQRLDAIMGRGSTGLRAEVLIRDFTDAATDYRMIVPMLAGTMVGQLAGAGILGRLAGTPRATWLTRGVGARTAAKLGGFALEVPAFAGLSHLLSGGQGSFEQHLQGAGITLGAMKLAGWGTQTLARRTGVFSNRPLSLSILQQTGVFGGLMAAHKIEVALGLRPGGDGATTVTDTLAAMVSLSVGANLGHRTLGPRWTAFQQELGLRVQMGKGNPESSWGMVFASPKGGRISGNLWMDRPSRAWDTSQPMMMAAKGEGGKTSGSGKTSAVVPKEESFPHSHTVSEELVGVVYESEIVSANPINHLPLIGLRMHRALMDVILAGKEGQTALKGSLVEKLRTTAQLRDEIAGFSTKVQVRMDAVSGKILRIRAYQEAKVTLELLEEAQPAPPKPPAVTPPPPKPAEKPAPKAEVENPPPAPKKAKQAGKTPTEEKKKSPEKTPPAPKDKPEVDHHSRVGPHQLSPLQNEVLELMRGVKGEIQITDFQDLYDKKGKIPVTRDSVGSALRKLEARGFLESRTQPSAIEGFPDHRFYRVKGEKPDSEAGKPKHDLTSYESRVRRMGPHELTPLQAFLLEVMQEHPGERLSTSQVWEILETKGVEGVSESAVREGLYRLTEKGLLEKGKAPNPQPGLHEINVFQIKEGSDFAPEGASVEVPVPPTPQLGITMGSLKMVGASAEVPGGPPSEPAVDPGPFPSESPAPLEVGDAPASSEAGPTPQEIEARVASLDHLAALQLSGAAMASARRNIKNLVSGPDANLTPEQKGKLLDLYEAAIRGGDRRLLREIRDDFMSGKITETPRASEEKTSEEPKQEEKIAEEQTPVEPATPAQPPTVPLSDIPYGDLIAKQLELLDQAGPAWAEARNLGNQHFSKLQDPAFLSKYKLGLRSSATELFHILMKHQRGYSPKQVMELLQTFDLVLQGKQHLRMIRQVWEGQKPLAVEMPKVDKPPSDFLDGAVKELAFLAQNKRGWGPAHSKAQALAERIRKDATAGREPETEKLENFLFDQIQDWLDGYQEGAVILPKQAIRIMIAVERYLDGTLSWKMVEAIAQGQETHEENGVAVSEANGEAVDANVSTALQASVMRALQETDREMRGGEVHEYLETQLGVVTGIRQTQIVLKELAERGIILIRVEPQTPPLHPLKFYRVKKGSGNDGGSSDPEGGPDGAPPVPEEGPPVAPASSAASTGFQEGEQGRGQLETVVEEAKELNAPQELPKAEEQISPEVKAPADTVLAPTPQPQPVFERVIFPEKGGEGGLLGMGSVLRVASVPGASKDGLKSFTLHILFPNLNRWSIPLKVTTRGEIRVEDPEDGRENYYAGGAHRRLRSVKPDNFESRLQVHFSPKHPPLEINLHTAQTQKEGITGIALAPRHPEYPGPLASFFSPFPPAPRQVTVLHHERVSDNTIKHGGHGAHFQKYRFFLSNGDLMEVKLESNHHGKGHQKVLNAKLHRFGSPEDEWTPLDTKSFRAGNLFRMVLKGGSYHLEFNLIPPGQTQGESILQDFRVPHFPRPVHLKLAGSENAAAEVRDASPAEAETAVTKTEPPPPPKAASGDGGQGNPVLQLGNRALSGDLAAIAELGELAKADEKAYRELISLLDMFSDPKFGEENNEVNFREAALQATYDAIGAAAQENPKALEYLTDFQELELADTLPWIRRVAEGEYRMSPQARTFLQKLPEPSKAEAAPKIAIPSNENIPGEVLEKAAPDHGVKPSYPTRASRHLRLMEQAVPKPPSARARALEMIARMLSANQRKISRGDLFDQLNNLAPFLSMEERQDLAERYLPSLIRQLYQANPRQLLVFLDVVHAMSHHLAPERRQGLRDRLGEHMVRITQISVILPEINCILNGPAHPTKNPDLPKIFLPLPFRAGESTPVGMVKDLLALIHQAPDGEAKDRLEQRVVQAVAMLAPEEIATLTREVFSVLEERYHQDQDGPNPSGESTRLLITFLKTLVERMEAQQRSDFVDTISKLPFLKDLIPTLN